MTIKGSSDLNIYKGVEGIVRVQSKNQRSILFGDPPAEFRLGRRL